MPVMFLDESEQGQFLCVGGVYAAVSAVGRVEARWRDLKQRLGLGPGDCFKWSPEERVTKKLKSLAEARLAAAELVASLEEMTAVSVVLQERRGNYVVSEPGRKREILSWDQLSGNQRGGVRHFYLRGLEFAVQRFARDCDPPEEHAAIVVDNLDWTRNPKNRKTLVRMLKRLPQADKWAIKDWIKKGTEAAREAYARWLHEGLDSPGYQTRPLKDLLFESTFHEAAGRWSDALQIADFIAGCSAAFFADLDKDKVGGASERYLRLLLPRLRNRPGVGCGVWGNGLVLWPPNHTLWEVAKKRLS